MSKKKAFSQEVMLNSIPTIMVHSEEVGGSWWTGDHPGVGPVGVPGADLREEAGPLHLLQCLLQTPSPGPRATVLMFSDNQILQVRGAWLLWKQFESRVFSWRTGRKCWPVASSLPCRAHFSPPASPLTENR